MGMLVDGVWRDDPAARQDGRFVRVDTQFRNWVTENGRPGPTGTGGFKAEAGRYHLYVSLACPWAHRTLIMRKLKNLEHAVGVSVVHWHMGEQGWRFEEGPGATGDRLYGHEYLYQLYTRAKPGYSGRASVPVLWDRETRTIVSNESAEIIRMLNDAFRRTGARGPDFYPQPLRATIDAINALVYAHVNNGVYKAGFARRQDAYEEAVTKLFQTLDDLDEHLASRRYLAGDQITEADIRLFTTLVRFDAVYVGHFKCNLKRLVEYAHLWPYARELYQEPSIAATVDFHHIKHHYYGSQASVNPTGIVPLGPLLDWDEPTGGADGGRYRRLRRRAIAAMPLLFAALATRSKRSTIAD
jgi:putative glutathione S-transferase